MREKASTTSRIAAAILIIVNIIVLTCSVLMFSVGVWMVASAQTLSNVIQNYGHPTMKALLPREVLSVQLGSALSILALFLFFISFMGLYGAVSRSLFLLMMYSILTLLLLLLELALLYYFASDLKQKGLQERDGQWTHALRLAFKCCDHNVTNLPSFQYSYLSQLPWSCCGTAAYPDNCTAPNIQNKNCNETITNWINKYQTPIYTSLAVLHIILLSCSLFRRARNVPSLSPS